VSGKPGAGWWNSVMFRYDILPDPPVAVSKGKKGSGWNGAYLGDIVDASPGPATEKNGIITNNDCFFRVIPWLFTGVRF
jgi:hypothetical protein